MTTDPSPDGPPLADHLSRLRTRALLVGGVSLAVCALALLDGPEAFFESYLVGYVYWWQIAVGGLGLSLLHQLVGGGWGLAARPFFAATASTFFLLAVLVVPVLLGMEHLFPWTREEYVHAHHVLEKKTFYLNEPFFVGRAFGYFVVWLLLTAVANASTARQVARTGLATPVGLRGFSGGGLVLFFLVSTFAAFDWMMSLDPLWFSTIYGALVVVGGGVGAFALATACVALLPLRLPDPDGALVESSPGVRNDLGNLLMAFVMLWTYFSFSQYLVIWSGNLPDEISWYVARSRDGWQFVSPLLALFHFAVPMLCLLSRDFKRTPRLLGGLAVGLLVVRLVDVLWNVVPTFGRDGFPLRWSDPVAVVGVGGLWTAVFLWRLPRFLSPETLQAPAGRRPADAARAEETHHG
jgi:hypothetical protein